MWRRFFQPPKPGAEKNAIYECGVESEGEAQIQFRSQYYLYAIIFLIFDVEAVFLVPFALSRGVLGCLWGSRLLSLPAVAAASGFDDRRGYRHEENGATNRPTL